MNWGSFTLGFLAALFIALAVSTYFCGKAVAASYQLGWDRGYRHAIHEGFHAVSIGAHRVFGRAAN